MKPSHLHIAFKDQWAAAVWFEKVLGVTALQKTAKLSVFRFDGLDVVLDSDWGEGDTSMTIAFQTDNCQRDYDRAVKNGALARTPPRDKGPAIGADVFGPGKVVIEFEQVKLGLG